MQRFASAAHAAWTALFRPLLRVVLLSALGAAVAPPVQAAGNQNSEATGVAKQAMDYYKAGEFPMAAELYRRAFRLDPTRPEYLFGLGRSLQNAQKFQDAMLAYESLLALLPATDPWSKKGRNAVRELQATMSALEKSAVHVPAPIKAEPVAPAPPPEPVKVVVEVRQLPAEPPKPAPPVVAPAPAPALPALQVEQIAQPVAVPRPAWRTWTQWSLLGVGAVALVAGVGVYGAAASDRSVLDAKLGQTQNGYISGIGYADATAQAAAIGQHKTAGAIAMGVGAASAVAGGVLWWLDRSMQAAWLPVPVGTGVAWAGRF